MQTCNECGRQSPLTGPLEHFHGCSLSNPVHYGPGATPMRQNYRTTWTDHTTPTHPQEGDENG